MGSRMISNQFTVLDLAGQFFAVRAGPCLRSTARESRSLFQAFTESRNAEEPHVALELGTSNSHPALSPLVTLSNPTGLGCVR